MQHVLKALYEQRKPVSVFINTKDPSRCNSGYIIGINDTQIALLSVDNDAQAQAIYVFSISMIFRVDTGGDFELKLTLSQSDLNRFSALFSDSKGNYFDLLCSYAGKEQLYLWVSFVGNDEIGAYGLSLEVKDNILWIDRFSDDVKKENLGQSAINLNFVDFIACEFM